MPTTQERTVARGRGIGVDGDLAQAASDSYLLELLNAFLGGFAATTHGRRAKSLSHVHAKQLVLVRQNPDRPGRDDQSDWR